MKKLNLVFICCYMLLLSACKDDNAGPTTYTIAGHLYVDCSQQPKSNFHLLLYQKGAYNPFTGVTTGGELASATTDANGYFKFEFKDLKGSENIIQYAAGAGYNDAMINIPTKTSLDNLVVYINPTTNIQVKLNVINPHTSSDTLFIKDFNTIEGFRILGPFYSGVAFTTTNASLPVMTFGSNNDYVNWYLHPYTGTAYTKYFTIDKYCNDTVTVTIDIN